MGDLYYSRALAEQQLRDLGLPVQEYCLELLLSESSLASSSERMALCIHGHNNNVDGHRHAADHFHKVERFRPRDCRVSADGTALDRDRGPRGPTPGRGGRGARPNTTQYGDGRGAARGKGGRGGRGAPSPQGFGGRPGRA